MSPHNAPSVIYPLGRSRFLGWLLLLAWSLTGLLTAAWWHAVAAGDARPWLGWATWLLAGFVIARGWHSSPVGQLGWDGQHWTWESPVYQDGGNLEAPHVVLDLQSAVLLRLDNPAGASWWLWAERRALPPRWLDLRRAIYARPRPQAQTDILAGQSDFLGDAAKVKPYDPSLPLAPAPQAPPQ
jgi:hypothetical protein